MNRMVPLVRRRIRTRACFPAAALRPPLEFDEAASWIEEAKLFAAGWMAGLVVFGTLFA